MSSTEIYRWGATQRRISDEGEAARKEALAWLETNADDNAGAEITLKAVPNTSGCLALAREGGDVLGVAVGAGPTVYLEALEARQIWPLLDDVSEGLVRVWCPPKLAEEAQAWMASNGGFSGSQEFQVLRSARLSESPLDAKETIHSNASHEGARPATMGDLEALDEYGLGFKEECGFVLTRDWPGAIGRGEVAVIESDGVVASFAMKFGQTSRLSTIGGGWTRPDARRQGLAAGVTCFLLEQVLTNRPTVQVLVNEGNVAGIGLYHFLGFGRSGSLSCLTRAT
ncbi:MAG: ribosomal protein S18 acetylase RimI-like enzyme [Planctomycetota bacterium]|jgi:ribosomal protein S18 acetylase RimI-like enzyme